MIKVTKCDMENKKVILKDDDNKVQKIVYDFEKVVIFEGKKIVKTLKSERSMKKYVEIVESHIAKKGLNKKEVEEVQQELNLEEKEEVKSLVDYIEEKKEDSKGVEVVGVVESQEEPKGIKVIEEPKGVEVVEPIEKKKAVIIEDSEPNGGTQEDSKGVEVVESQEEPKEENFDINNVPLTNKTIVIDATCKAFKERVDGVLNRCTKFTIFTSTESEKLSDLLTVAIANRMESILYKKYGYGLVFDDDSKVSYKRGDSYCCEMTLIIPYASGMSEIRKNVCSSYYASKKEVQAFYKQLRMMKEAQEKKQEKKKASA